MSAWCHGAPGIGLSRLRAYEVLKDDIYKVEAERAIENTIKSISIEQQNYSMCHGALGNAETLIYGYQVLGNPDYLNKAEEIAIKGWESAEKINKPWRCGTMNSVSDPSFMLGEAGIGYYLLRLVNQDVPSLLAPVTTQKSNYNRERKNKNELISVSISVHLFRSIKVVKAGESDIIKQIEAFDKEDGTFVELTESVMQKLFDLGKESEKVKYLSESTFIEKESIDILKRNKDFTTEYIYSLKKEPFARLDTNIAQIFLNPLNKSINLSFNWNEIDTNGLPKEEQSSFILFLQHGKPHLRKINLLALLIINELEKPNTINVIVNKVIENFDLTNENQREELKKKVINQLAELYNANHIMSDGKTLNNENELSEIPSTDQKCEHCNKHSFKV